LKKITLASVKELLDFVALYIISDFIKGKRTAFDYARELGNI